MKQRRFLPAGRIAMSYPSDSATAISNVVLKIEFNDVFRWRSYGTLGHLPDRGSPIYQRCGNSLTIAQRFDSIPAEHAHRRTCFSRIILYRTSGILAARANSLRMQPLRHESIAAPYSRFPDDCSTFIHRSFEQRPPVWFLKRYHGKS